MTEFNYRHPNWIKRKKQILERDNFTCRCCRRESLYSDVKLHVHHTSYNIKWELWDYPDDRLITLCDDCHNTTHCTLDEIKDIMDEIQSRYIEHAFKVPLVLNKLLRDIRVEQPF